jgi:hypothetical protein
MLQKKAAPHWQGGLHSALMCEMISAEWEAPMLAVCIVEERPPYLLLNRGDRYAVVERRNSRFYGLGGVRSSAPMTDLGADAVVGDGWSDEVLARRLFEDLADRYAALAERMR